MEELPSGTLIKDTYKVLSPLGRGGMSRVYLVEDSQGMQLALKMNLSPRETGSTPGEVSARFRREIEILTMLSHPYLPKIVDYFTIGAGNYVIEEYVTGTSLEEYVSHNTLNEVEVIDLAVTLCEVLEFLHRNMVIFRDLKPANIIVTKQQQLKLIDFDIARFYQKGKAADTEALGTPGFAAPESYGSSQSDARSDIYSLGATMHNLLTGIDPQDNPFHFEPITNIRHDISGELIEIVERALKREPEKRFKSAGQMKKALRTLRKKTGPPQSSFSQFLKLVSSCASHLGQVRSKVIGSLTSDSMMLMKAAKEGNLKSVMALLSQGCDVNAVDNEGKTSLHWAVMNRDIQMIELLIRKRARLDMKDGERMTPMDWSIYKGFNEIERFLHKKGAHLNVYDKSGMMRLHFAACTGQFSSLTMFTSCELLNRQDHRGRMPIHYAVERDMMSSVEYLLAYPPYGAQLDVQDDNGHLPLHLATNLVMLKKLLLCSPSRAVEYVNLSDKKGKTLLYYAVERGETGWVEFLIKEGASINFVTRDKITLLFLAIKGGYSDIARLLIEKGCKIHAKNKEGKTALLMAIEKRLWIVAEMLIRRGAGINVEDSEGKTPLIFAAENNGMTLAELLIKKGAEINHRDNYGRTPLHYAVLGISENMVTMLMEKGANIAEKDHWGRTPHDIAVMNDESIIAYLLCRTQPSK